MHRAALCGAGELRVRRGLLRDALDLMAKVS
jgi:hypothetical protein